MLQGIVFSLPGIAPNNEAPGLSVNKGGFGVRKISSLYETEPSLHLLFFFFLMVIFNTDKLSRLQNPTPSSEMRLEKQTRKRERQYEKNEGTY